MIGLHLPHEVLVTSSGSHLRPLLHAVLIFHPIGIFGEPIEHGLRDRLSKGDIVRRGQPAEDGVRLLESSVVSCSVGAGSRINGGDARPCTGLAVIRNTSVPFRLRGSLPKCRRLPSTGPRLHILANAVAVGLTVIFRKSLACPGAGHHHLQLTGLIVVGRRAACEARGRHRQEDWRQSMRRMFLSSEERTSIPQRTSK